MVTLTETSTTLELLFQYIYRRPQPNLERLNFKDLSSLAEAAEKYQVFSAMEVCRLLMRSSLTDFPLEVLAYSCRHGYSELSDEAAPNTLGTSAPTALSVLGYDSFNTWILYREPWINVLRSALEEPSNKVLHRGGRTDCVVWNKFHLRSISMLNSNLTHLGDLESVFDLTRHLLDDCDHCQIRLKQWHKALEKAVEGTPKFSAH